MLMFCTVFFLPNYNLFYLKKKKCNGISESNSKTLEVLFILTEKDKVITASLFCIRLSYSISEEKFILVLISF